MSRIVAFVYGAITSLLLVASINSFPWSFFSLLLWTLGFTYFLGIKWQIMFSVGIIVGVIAGLIAVGLHLLVV